MKKLQWCSTVPLLLINIYKSIEAICGNSEPLLFCCLFGAKLLTQTISTYCLMHPQDQSWVNTASNYITFQLMRLKLSSTKCGQICSDLSVFPHAPSDFLMATDTGIIEIFINVIDAIETSWHFAHSSRANLSIMTMGWIPWWGRHHLLVVLWNIEAKTKWSPVCRHLHIDVLVQDCSNSSMLAMELLQSCTKALIDFLMFRNHFILIQIPVEYIPKDLMINTSVLVQVTAWCLIRTT